MFQAFLELFMLGRVGIPWGTLRIHRCGVYGLDAKGEGGDAGWVGEGAKGEEEG